MPRPRKYRQVCQFPQTVSFVPADLEGEQPGIILEVDEYEVVRLIDKEGLSQEECGEHMGIARTTVQQIYANARKKLADMLVDGVPLQIAGGDFRLCDGTRSMHHCNECFMYQFRQQYQKTKGDHSMRIAVTYENGNIFQHFGHTEQFKLYDVEDGAVVSSQVTSANGSGHSALAGVLTALQVDTLICGGIGGGAKSALDAAGIKLYGGVSGDADKAVQALLDGTLSFDPNVACSHHGENHHGHHGHHGGSCGEHGCTH